MISSGHITTKGGRLPVALAVAPVSNRCGPVENRTHWSWVAPQPVPLLAVFGAAVRPATSDTTAPKTASRATSICWNPYSTSLGGSSSMPEPLNRALEA